MIHVKTSQNRIIQLRYEVPTPFIDVFRNVLLCLSVVYLVTQIYFVWFYALTLYLLLEKDPTVAFITGVMICIKYIGIWSQFYGLWEHKAMWEKLGQNTIYAMVGVSLVSSVITGFLLTFAMEQYSEGKAVIYELLTCAILEIVGAVYLFLMAIEMPITDPYYPYNVYNFNYP